MWCIPPEANAEFAWRMEDVLSVYQRPYDPAYPQVCRDESSKQLVAEVRSPIGVGPGKVRRQGDFLRVGGQSGEQRGHSAEQCLKGAWR